MTVELDDAVVAAVMLVGHTGARELDFGYLHDDVPIADAGWWATALYRGAKVTVEDYEGPVEALEALAERLLTGAWCQWCGGLVALSSEGAVAFPGEPMADGSRMPTDPEEIAKLGQCWWARRGQRWEPGCLHGVSSGPRAPHDRAARRRMRRAYDASRPGASS